MSFWNSPGSLLIATGVLLGLTFPFGKLAAAAGVSPFVWSFVIAFGGGAVLLAALLASGRRMTLSPDRLLYFMITAAVSYALPNLLLFSAIPRLGAGYSGVMFTLSPVLTLLLSMLMRLKRPSALGVAGVAVGFVGAVTVAVTRGEVGRPADPIWVALALLIPLSLAVGNIYRSEYWPADAGPIELAAGSNLAAAVLLCAASLIFTGGFDIAPAIMIPWLAAAQVAASAAMFSLFFRLQAVGGPIYLSQIGYVAAALALIIGTLALGESYAALTWVGALVIAAGVAMTTLAQRDSAIDDRRDA